MQDLIARGDAPGDATVPNQLSSERLWDLDVDDDLWTDLARDGQYQDNPPKWLFDEPTKQGIRAMLDLQRSDEELDRLDHERSVMSAWLQGQGEQLQHASNLAQGTRPIVLPLFVLIRPTTRQYPPAVPDCASQNQSHTYKPGLENEYQCRHW